MNKLISNCPACNGTSLVPMAIGDERVCAVLIATLYNFKCRDCGEMIEVRVPEPEESLAV